MGIRSKTSSEKGRAPNLALDRQACMVIDGPGKKEPRGDPSVIAKRSLGLAVVTEGLSRGMWTPDKDWRLGICAGVGMGLFIFIVPGLFGIVHLGILGIVLMAVVGFMAGLIAYSVLFL